MNAYKEADQWQQALTLAQKTRMAGPELTHFMRSLAEQLEEQHKYEQAARVLLRLPDMEAGIELLCRAHAFVDAQYECAAHDRWDLMETHVAPGLLETQSSLLEEASEIEEQMTKQVRRLFELDAKRDEDLSLIHI